MLVRLPLRRRPCLSALPWACDGRAFRDVGRCEPPLASLEQDPYSAGDRKSSGQSRARRATSPGEREATLDVVKTLASFAPTGPDDDTDEGRRIEPLMGLLGDLGGPAAMSELHRWLTREDAARGARAMAALALGRAHDHTSTPAIVRLLDPPDPAGPGHNNGRIRVIEALRLMPAPEATGSVYAALLRLLR